MKESAYKGLVGALLVAVLVLCSLTAVCAQEDDDGPVWVSYGNQYIKALIGTSGQIPDVDLPVGGRWSVVTEQGDPETDGDNDREIIWYGLIAPCGNYGFWNLRINNTNYLVGDTSTGNWLVNGAENFQPRVYTAPPVGQGAQGGYIRAIWRNKTDLTGNPPVDFALKVSLVRDLVRFETTITNRTSSRLSVGLAMHGDVEVTGSFNINYPFVPGIGFTRSTLYPERFVATLFGRNFTKVPDSFDIYDNLANPALVARNVIGLEDATKPEYVAIGEFRDLSPVPPSCVWLPDRTSATAYTPDDTKAVDDYFWVLCWDQKSLSPGASRKIVTYYGVGAATSRWTQGTKKTQDNVVLAVQGPRALKYNSLAGNPTALDPASFTVSAYINNMAIDAGPYDLNDVTARIDLPRGLRLVPAPGHANDASKSVGAVPRNSESAPVVWIVEPTGEYSGELEYFVTAYDSSGWSQTVTRKVMVPADKQKLFHYGWQLVSVPFGFNDPSISHVFGLAPGTFGAKYWDPISSPSAGNYFPVTQVKPGQGFWMAVSSIPGYGQTLAKSLPVDASILGASLGKQVLEQNVQIYRGWNMIGSPFVYPVYWGQVLVFDPSSKKTFTLDQAVSKGWLSRTLHTWNPLKFAYDYVRYNEEMLMPFQGYWLYQYSSTPKTLIFRPALFPSADVTADISGT